MRGVVPRLALLTPIALVVALIGPAQAGAHVRTGRVAVDYRASVSSVSPPRAGAVMTVRIYEGDLAVGLTVEKHHRVTVLGYAGEPLLRIGTEGVDVNESSTTAAGMGLVKGGRKTAGAGPEGGTALRSERSSGTTPACAGSREASRAGTGRCRSLWTVTTPDSTE